jgi:hypothetical protein
MFKKVSKSFCTSIVMVLPDPLSPIPTTSSSAMNIPENTEEDPEPVHESDIQMEYSSDELHSSSIGAVTNNNLQELMSG